MLTAKKLVLICPNLTLARAEKLTEDINFITPSYHINTIDVMEEWLAQAAHESGGFRIKEENMNYKSPERIVKIWSSRFTIGNSNGKADARLYINNPQKLANKVYGGRMGNNFITDGYDFRGSGFMQLTGRESATAYANYWGNTPEAIMQLLRTEDWWAIDAACWEFAVNKKLIELAKQDKFLTITKRINGGIIGLADRDMYYQRCKKYLP